MLMLSVCLFKGTLLQASGSEDLLLLMHLNFLNSRKDHNVCVYIAYQSFRYKLSQGVNSFT